MRSLLDRGNAAYFIWFSNWCPRCKVLWS